MTETLIETDSRGRISLGKGQRRYLMREAPDGTLTLEPAVVMSEMERRFWMNADLQARIAYLEAHPEELVTSRRRAERRAQ